ncbi:MAG TPA: SPOR domain-containing protein [Noviherbaspirillum sp.]|jgi:DedD protein|uniref:SPOR domain-containing protein n=1 Tax=Noviherbaspirillum sp. TaxID=1926288 RepID=UPI002DDCFE25|nr:SPOR domain-containing protein [Noviherbaspirillum sp.]HEV2609597.1 SPOR domain-containing protein [Noviherbaspirillum sp.]
MSLFSFLRKNKQESAAGDSSFYSRAEDETQAPRTRKRRQGKEGGQAVDPVLPEKKRARRRLIGAVALVMAAVIGLPMLLDAEPKPLADDIAIQIPSKDKSALPQVSRPAAPAGVSASASLDPKEEVIDPPVAPSKAEALPAEKPAIAEKPATVQLAAKPDVKAEQKAAPKVDDSARAKALLDGGTDPTKTSNAAKKDGKFVIQVAALASKDKVDELQSKLKGAGIKSYTQTVATQSGERIRIRVGPFGNKEEADKVRAKISKLGLSGTLVPA